MSRRPRLLVVEDDPAILSLFVAYLEKDGYQVAGAATAASAEAMVKKQDFDLILLDLGLPDEDGLVVARRIRASSTTPLVFVTQRASDADKIAGLELGADDYVTKPSTLESFRRAFAISSPAPIAAVPSSGLRTLSASVSGPSISVGTRCGTEVATPCR